MIRRLVSLLALLWCLGFAAFMVTLPGPLSGNTTDAIVVPTGGAGRIDRGLDLLRDGQAKRMLVTGVGAGVRPADLARTYPNRARLFVCCVDLGPEAVDTRSNAEETQAWVAKRGYRSVRLVTSDWHVARARMELAAALGPGVVILGDGVRSEPRLGILIGEYNKLLLRRVALWLGIGA
ncbi:MAG TPA: YdcF family protein [Sphingomonas sp.]|jgi:uncharacterized SAM-binding protein YcdF (DUF218 family)